MLWDSGVSLVCTFASSFTSSAFRFPSGSFSPRSLWFLSHPRCSLEPLFTFKIIRLEWKRAGLDGVGSHEKTVEPPSRLTMQCCGNANISSWAHTLTLFLAKPPAFLVRTMPTVISNITFTNQYAAEIFPGTFPTKWNGQLWKSIFNRAVFCTSSRPTSGRLRDVCGLVSLFPIN